MTVNANTWWDVLDSDKEFIDRAEKKSLLHSAVVQRLNCSFEPLQNVVNDLVGLLTNYERYEFTRREISLAVERCGLSQGGFVKALQLVG